MGNINEMGISLDEFIKNYTNSLKQIRCVRNLLAHVLP